MTQLTAYLNFNGNCREAMNFYKECLGGDLTVQTVAESPMAAEIPAAMGNSVLHASLTSGAINLLGSDMAGSGLVKGNSVTLSLICSSREELNRLFMAIAEGGEVKHPVHDFFAGTMGNLVDRFGFTWMFYCGKS